MKLESIQTGKKRTVTYNGETVTTGIFKDEKHEQAFVSTLGIGGDEQANLDVHGGVDKAVYAYPIEHFEFWKQQREGMEFYPGVFGENLTISGFLEEEVYVGDVFQIGEVKLSVTTPRMPCNKLGIKMKDKSFIRDFLQSERSGFYFKVLNEGNISVGNTIKRTEESEYKLSIKELVQLFTSRKDDLGLLKKAIACPSLIERWRTDFEEKLNQKNSKN